MPVQIVFETHSWSEDNDRGLRLSDCGLVLARELGQRRSGDGLTAGLVAFAGCTLPVPTS